MSFGSRPTPVPITSRRTTPKAIGAPSSSARVNQRRRIVRAIALEHRTTTRRVSRALGRREPWALNAFTLTFAAGVAGER